MEHFSASCSATGDYRAVVKEREEGIAMINLKVAVFIKYINSLGEGSVRIIEPGRFYFGSNHYHKEEQWLLDAFDHSRQSIRTFAMKDISWWEPYSFGVDVEESNSSG